MANMIKEPLGMLLCVVYYKTEETPGQYKYTLK